MEQLRQWNNIQNNFIYPGQKLIIQASAKRASKSSVNSGSGSVSGSSTGSPKKDDDPRDKIVKAQNMHQFFNETEFGKKIKPFFEKIRGSQKYRAKKDLTEYGIKKGDTIYLDTTHADHLEVFDSIGEAKQVLNLDGTYNRAKSVAAKHRVIP